MAAAGEMTPTAASLRSCVPAAAAGLAFGSDIGPSIGTKHPVPVKIDHSEITIVMPMMSKVEFLLASEPCKPLKA